MIFQFLKINIQKIFLTFILISSISQNSFAFGNIQVEAQPVSMIQLIAAPQKYHNKLIRVIGVSHIGFESNSIWLNKEHYRNNVIYNSLWIKPNYTILKTTAKKLQKMNGNYVLIEGYFNQNNKGHFGMYIGTIEEISRFDLWERK